jgi:hypothetical protein
MGTGYAEDFHSLRGSVRPGDDGHCHGGGNCGVLGRRYGAGHPLSLPLRMPLGLPFDCATLGN